MIMSAKIFSDAYISSLIVEAEASDRLRQHRNIHHSYDDPCQRLINAICVGSYIAPHRHAIDPRNECLFAVRGLFAAVIFDYVGKITQIELFGTQKVKNISVGIELTSETWHTILAMEEGSVLFEVKEGPFDPNLAKEHADWAPAEGSSEARSYHLGLMVQCQKALNLLKN